MRNSGLAAQSASSTGRSAGFPSAASFRLMAPTSRPRLMAIFDSSLRPRVIVLQVNQIRNAGYCSEWSGQRAETGASMCLAVPGKVIGFHENDGLRMSKVDFGGV